MTITERTLRRWRKDALRSRNVLSNVPTSLTTDSQWLGKSPQLFSIECQERILRLTQELLDLALLKRSKS